MTVSPGSQSGVALVEARCPTFSWSEVVGAVGYELVVYRLGQESEEAVPEFTQRVSAAALSWTPSLDQSLERGARYAWWVRALGETEDPGWSNLSLFQVAAPTVDEFEEALALVRSYLAIQGGNALGTDEVADGGPEEDPPSVPSASAAAHASRAATPTALKVDQGVEAASFKGDGSELTDVTAVDFTGLLSGDVAGPQSATIVERVQSTPVSSTVPTGGQLLRYDATGSEWEPGAVLLGSSSAVSGILPPAGGGTGSDLSATGGSGQYLQQGTPGSAVTVGAIPAKHLPSHEHSASDLTSGTLEAARGGTGASAVGSSGSVAFSTGSAYSFTDPGTSGQVLKSRGVGSPTWGTVGLAETTGILTLARGGTGAADATGARTNLGAAATEDLTSHTASATAHHLPPTTLPPSGAAGGDLAGTYPNPTVGTNAVGSAEITDGSVAAADLAFDPATQSEVSALQTSIDALQDRFDCPGAAFASGGRFVDCGNGTIRDMNTGKIWLKNANCFGLVSWQSAKDAAAALKSGDCGLTDGSLPGQWRLPEIEELCSRDAPTPIGGSCPAVNATDSLMNTNFSTPSVSNAAGVAGWSADGDAFVGVQSHFYWSATVTLAGFAWVGYFDDGHTGMVNDVNVNYVWPVRGGQ